MFFIALCLVNAYLPELCEWKDMLRKAWNYFARKRNLAARSWWKHDYQQESWQAVLDYFGEWTLHDVGGFAIILASTVQSSTGSLGAASEFFEDIKTLVVPPITLTSARVVHGVRDVRDVQSIMAPKAKMAPTGQQLLRPKARAAPKHPPVQPGVAPKQAQPKKRPLAAVKGSVANDLPDGSGSSSSSSKAGDLPLAKKPRQQQQQQQQQQQEQQQEQQ